MPCVADRIAQTAVAMVLSPGAEAVFHQDSYGYRPRRSTLEAVESCKQRCWRYPWVIDLDIQGFFDNVPHDPILAAVSGHTDLSWVLLYVKRWLIAPIQQPNGTLIQRDKGTPQGSAISPLLSNLFMHYAFDSWLDRECPSVRFKRYCDDAVVHCTSEKQAIFVRDSIERRLRQFGLNLHPDKTHIVYCKQDGIVVAPRAGKPWRERPNADASPRSSQLRRRGDLYLATSGDTHSAVDTASTSGASTSLWPCSPTPAARLQGRPRKGREGPVVSRLPGGRCATTDLGLPQTHRRRLRNAAARSPVACRAPWLRGIPARPSTRVRSGPRRGAGGCRNRA